MNYVIYNKELPVQSPTWSEQEIHPSFSWAFELGARSTFPEGQDVSVNWTHLNTSTSTSIAAPDASFFLGPDYEIGPTAIPNRQATGYAQFNYNVINLEAGQTVIFGRHVMMRFFGGLSNAYLNEQVNASFSGNVPSGPYAGPFTTRQKVTSNFTGIGPRFGIDGNYEADNGFGFMGGAAFSALIGYSYAITKFISNSQEILIRYAQRTNSQSIKDQNVTQVIPGFDAKLGVTYKHKFNCGSLVTLTAGYAGAVYVNAINQYLPQSLVGDAVITALDTGGIFVATMAHRQSNYSVQGPFFTVTFRV